MKKGLKTINEVIGEIKQLENRIKKVSVEYERKDTDIYKIIIYTEETIDDNEMMTLNELIDGLKQKQDNIIGNKVRITQRYQGERGKRVRRNTMDFIFGEYLIYKTKRN